MVVKRLQRETFVQPIGVVRANAGAGLVGNAVSNFADQMAQEAFRKAAIKAQEVGTEAAASLSSQSIATLDPVTNKPVKYTAPSGYGEVAASAYQNMIKSRFEDSVKSELARKGAEFAASSASAADYKNKMSSYVESMYEADGEATPYSRYIMEYGKEYVGSTYSTLAKREAEALRKKLIQSQKISLFEGESHVNTLISAGADRNIIAEEIQKLYIKAENLLEVEGITFSEYTRRVESLRGLNSLSANTALTNIFESLSDSDRELFKMGLSQPSIMADLSEKLGIPSLVQISISAKVGASPETLIRGFEAFAGFREDYVESETSELTAGLAPSVVPSMTSEGVNALVKDIQDPDVRNAVREELMISWITKNLDSAAVSAKDIDAITSIIRSEGVISYKDIEDLIGGEQGKRIANELKVMNPDDRDALATNLEDRAAATRRLESLATSDAEQSLRRQIGFLENGMDLDSDYDNILNAIKSDELIDEALKERLVGNLNALYADVAMRRSTDISLSIEELETVRDMLANPSDKGISELSENSREAYELLSKAYELEVTATDRFVSNRITAIQNQNTRASNELRLSVIETSLDQVSAEDLEWYQESTLGDTVLIASEMMSNPVVSSSLRRGVVLPKVKDAMEAALNSLDEKQLTTALQIFDQYSNTTKTVNSTGELPLDIMRQSLSPSAYASYRAMVYAAAEQGIEPMAIALQLRNYDGNIDADIKADLEIPKSADLNRVFEGINISPGYRQDILSMLRVRKALGASITEDTVTSVIDGYTQKMRKDSRVISPRVGDKSFYSRKQYFSQGEIIRNREQMLDLMDESGLYNHLLTGGTVIDQYSQVLNLMAGGELAQGARAMFEALGAGDELRNRERVSDDVRTRQKKRIMRAEIAYRPIIQSFNAGEPRYEVGYMTELGQFEPILINNQPYLLEKNYQTETQANLRFATKNALVVANNAGAPKKDIAIAEINHLATLDHFDEELFLTANPLFVRKLDSLMGREEALKVFRSMKEKYEGSGQ